jgi:hypothetical protein
MSVLSGYDPTARAAQPLVQAEAPKRAPPDRIVVNWCPGCGAFGGVSTADKSRFARTHMCLACGGTVRRVKVRYQLAARRG